MQSEIATANNQGSAMVTYSAPQGMVNLQDISLMLVEQMKEVKNNPGAIPQAECAAMIAGRIVDIAKTQVEQAKIVNDLVRTKNGL